MTKFFKRISFAAAILIFASGCSAEKKRTEFAHIYADILYARERNHDTAIANPEIREVLKRNGYTEETFRAKFSEYAQSSEDLRIVFDSANAIFQRKIEGKR